MKTWIYVVLCILTGLSGFNCKNNDVRHSNETLNDSTVSQNQHIELVFEVNSEEKTWFKPGKIPLINIRQKGNYPFDSIQVIFNQNLISTLNKLPGDIQIKEDIKKTGSYELETHIFVKGKVSIQKFTFSVVSDILPKIFGFEVVKVFPHDRKAYTQGLVYEDGYLYESNGMKNESTLRKLQIGTGEPIQSYTLPAEIFAEGLAIVGDKLIQISWQNYTGFVYDKKTFKVLAKFSYSTEGWGLTFDGNNLIMSDGTNRLYYLDPESFTEINRIEVFDNKGPVNDLNEMEYIHGEIYANIYQTSKIAIIDPLTGKVKAYIDLSNILSDKDYESSTDVLNGIAYDSKGNRLFVTGKRWPKMFEIKLIQKSK